MSVPYSQSTTSRRQSNVLRAQLSELQAEISELRIQVNQNAAIETRLAALESSMSSTQVRLARPSVFDFELEGVWARRDRVPDLLNPNARPVYVINTLVSIEITSASLKYWNIVGVDNSGGQGESEFISRLVLETTMSNFLQVRTGDRVTLRTAEMLQADQPSIESTLGQNLVFDFDSTDEFADTLTITVPGELISGGLDSGDAVFAPDITYTFIRLSVLSDDYEIIQSIYDEYDPD